MQRVWSHIFKDSHYSCDTFYSSDSLWRDRCFDLFCELQANPTALVPSTVSTRRSSVVLLTSGPSNIGWLTLGMNEWIWASGWVAACAICSSFCLPWFIAVYELNPVLDSPLPSFFWGCWAVPLFSFFIFSLRYHGFPVWLLLVITIYFSTCLPPQRDIMTKWPA